TDNTCISAPTPAALTAAIPPAAPTVTLVQPTCAVNTGTITVTAPLGAGFEYSINGTVYQAAPTFTAVAPGTYNVTVRSTTDNTCISPATPAVLTAAVPPVAPTVTLVQPTCAVNTGTITVTAPLGAGFEYSINGTVYQAAPTFTAVAPGTYNVTVRSTTDNTCISPATPAVLTAAVPPVAPTVTLVQPTCAVNTGTITVTAPLGAGFEYSINGTVYQAAPTFTAVAAGTYNVTVRSTTDNTCISVPTQAILTVPTPPTAPTVTLVQPTCTVNTGTITVTAPLGAGFEYSINGTVYQA